MKLAIEVAKQVLGPKHVSQQVDSQWRGPLEIMAKGVLRCADEHEALKADYEKLKDEHEALKAEKAASLSSPSPIVPIL